MSRKTGGNFSLSLVFFAFVSVIIFITTADTRPIWWVIVAGVALISTGVATFIDMSHRKKPGHDKR